MVAGGEEWVSVLEMRIYRYVTCKYWIIGCVSGNRGWWNKYFIMNSGTWLQDGSIYWELDTCLHAGGRLEVSRKTMKFAVGKWFVWGLRLIWEKDTHGLVVGGCCGAKRMNDMFSLVFGAAASMVMWHDSCHIYVTYIHICMDAQWLDYSEKFDFRIFEQILRNFCIFSKLKKNHIKLFEFALCFYWFCPFEFEHQ